MKCDKEVSPRDFLWESTLYYVSFRYIHLFQAVILSTLYCSYSCYVWKYMLILKAKVSPVYTIDSLQVVIKDIKCDICSNWAIHIFNAFVLLQKMHLFFLTLAHVCVYNIMWGLVRVWQEIYLAPLCFYGTILTHSYKSSASSDVLWEYEFVPIDAFAYWDFK